MAARDNLDHQNVVIGRHYPELDGLRAIAILLVMWWHASGLARPIQAEPLDSVSEIYYAFSSLGSSGVSLFFVISGFLITGILIDTASERKCLRTFYLRRCLRIFPLYYISLIVILAASSFLIAGWELDNTVFFYMFYVANWLPLLNNGFSFLGDVNYAFLRHFWSLAIEEQFYLLWPVLYLFLHRLLSVRFCVLAMCAAIILSVYLRLFLYAENYNEAAHIWTFSRLDGLLSGALIVYVFRCKNILLGERWSILFLMGLGIFSFLVVLHAARLSILFHDTVIFETLVFSGLMIYVLNAKKFALFLHVLRMKTMEKIAKQSYAIYIFHLPIMYIIQLQIKHFRFGFWIDHTILLVIGGGLSYLLAYISYRIIEKPFLRLKDKWAPYDKA